jgi:ubiquinone biosynthesis protein
MERVVGGKVTDHPLASDAAKRRVAGLVVEALVAQPIFSTDGNALFHADPHAGNLFLTPDSRLAVLDWSLVGSLGERERRAVVQVILAALLLDAEGVVAALAGLADGQRLDRAALAGVVRAGLTRVRRGQFPGFAWLTGLLDEAVQTAHLRVGADLLLFRKTLHTLEGVIADIGAGAGRAEEVLLLEFLGNFAFEWPGRWLARPDSHHFATRLSNADLLRFLLHWPWMAARFWLLPCAQNAEAIQGPSRVEG